MEEKKTIFDYLAQTMLLFGVTVLILNLFCLVFGNSAKDVSDFLSVFMRFRFDHGSPLCFFHGCGDQKNAGLVKNGLYADVHGDPDLGVYHSLSLVSDPFVAAVVHVLSLLRDLFCLQLLFCDAQREGGKQADGRSAAASEGK